MAISAFPADAEVRSEYTKITDDSCITFASPSEEEGGDWARLVCDGYRGYPIMLDYSDLRESVFYGFPPAGDMAPRWESFGNFNSVSGTVEWRIGPVESGRELPFATIHRWIVTPDDNRIEVLVVEKVGQPHQRDGCVVGYIVATGNADANVQAREVADQSARTFACSSDTPVIRTGSVDLPPVYVTDR